MNGLGCLSALRALGEETRLRILRLLVEEQLSVNDLAMRLHVSEYNVSKHLRVMKDAGLLEIDKQGRQRFYRVAKEFQAKAAETNPVLDLGCCTFRIDKLPG
jgi:DNA-binding transcriptional ArsR family regulator